MKELLSKLWADDLGGIVTAEYVMVMGVVTGGAVAGATMVRNSVTAGFARMGESVAAVVPDPETVRRQVLLVPVVLTAAPTVTAVPALPHVVPPAP